MEGASEAQMDTSVSSTTDDILQITEISSPHRAVETVITVEEVKEELASPTKQSPDKNDQLEASEIDKNEPPNSADKLQLKDPPNIKIILKRPPKPIQLQKPVPISPVKSTELQNIVGKEVSVSPIKSVEALNKSSISPNKASPSSNLCVEFLNKTMASVLPQQLKEFEDSSVKSDTSTNTNPNNNAKTVLVTTIADATKNTQKTQIKNVQNSTSKKTTPSIEPMLKVTTIKEQPTKIIISKDIPKHTQDKEVEVHSNKVDPMNISPLKEQPSKSTPAKETVLQNTSNISDLLINRNAPTKLDEELKSISSIDIDIEMSNDSQIETNSDVSDKEHNRNTSRELRSLINSAKESKIINECTYIKTKTRKSKTPLDTSMPNLNASVESDRIQGVRRSSDNSQQSSSSEVSDKSVFKRSMRSQNPEFVNKVKHFLNTVTGKIQHSDVSEEEAEVSKTKNDIETSSSPKRIKVDEEVSISI